MGEIVKELWSIAGGVGFIASAFIWIRQRLKERRKDRALMADLLRRAPWDEWYRGLLKHGLGKLDTFFGPNVFWNRRGPGACLGFAMYYSLLFFAVDWTSGGTGILAKKSMLPPIDQWKRQVIVVMSVGGLGTMYFSSRQLIRICKQSKINQNSSSFLFATFGIALALFGASTVAIQGNETTSIAFAIAFAISLCLASLAALAVIAMGIVILVALVTLGHQFVLGSSESLTDMGTTLFLLIIPILNACFDWPSWWISRKLISSLARESGLKKIVFHAGIDLLIAVLLLIGLAAGLGWGANALVALGSEENDVLSMITAATIAPWSADHRWITLMLITTLIPTALHLMVLIGSILMTKTPQAWRDKTADFLETWDDKKGSRFELDCAAVFITVQLLLGILITALAIWSFYWLSFGIWDLPLAKWLGSVAQFGYELGH